MSAGMYGQEMRAQQAQDARDRLAEQTGTLLTLIAQELELGDSPQIGRIIDAISDLRSHTGRDEYGRRD